MTLSTTVLGPTTIEISRLALGTMTFGVEADEASARDQLDAFVAAGGTYVDTADVYADGESERIIGRWLSSRRRDEIVLGTKGRFGEPGVAGASPTAVRAAVSASLERLGTDRVELYLLHGWDQDVPVEETLTALAELTDEGLVGAVGWSNVTGWQLQRIITTARLRELPVPSVVQPQYSLLDRGIEWELLPCCLDEEVAVTPWSPLGGGWLTGKYSRDARPEGATRLGEDPDRGVEAYDLRATERTWRVLDEVRAVARRHERPMAHVAIAWLLSRPGVASVLLGARTLEQLTDNLDAASLTLSDRDLATLTEVSAPGLPPYPYGMVEDFCDVPYWSRLGTAAPTP